MDRKDPFAKAFFFFLGFSKKLFAWTTCRDDLRHSSSDVQYVANVYMKLRP